MRFISYLTILIFLCWLPIALPASAQPVRLDFPDGSQFRSTIAALPAEQRTSVERAAAEVFPLFVFIPGIMGSKLTKEMPNGDSKVIWGKFGGVFAKPDDQLAYQETDKVSASVMEDYYVYNEGIDVYGRALKAIKAMDLTMGGDNVKRFAYDWRQSNRKSASAFSKWICQNQDQIRGRRLVILAHSMGGLVLKWWLKTSYDNDGCGAGDKFANWISIENIIFFGTPHFGAPKAITAFSSDYSILVDRDDSTISSLFAAIDAVTISKSLNVYGASFPSSYELLPIATTPGCQRNAAWPPLVAYKPVSSPSHDRIDLFNKETWRTLKWPKNLPPKEDRGRFVDEKLGPMLESARSFQCELSTFRANPRFNVVRIIGVRKSTICKVTIIEPVGDNSARTEVELCLDGDGTVPRWIVAEAGASPAIQTVRSGEGHMRLTGSQEFLEFLEDYTVELHNRMQQQASRIDGFVTMYTNLRIVVPSSSTGPANSASREISKQVAERLQLRPDEIYRTAQATSDPRARAKAYRLYADLTPTDGVRKAWALNNAAHIYLQRENFPAALKLGKSAIGLAIDNKMVSGSFLPRVGSTTATAAEQLNEAALAKTFRDLSIGKIDVQTLNRPELQM